MHDQLEKDRRQTEYFAASQMTKAVTDTFLEINLREELLEDHKSRKTRQRLIFELHDRNRMRFYIEYHGD